jgi:hypothetical protein
VFRRLHAGPTLITQRRTRDACAVGH